MEEIISKIKDVFSRMEEIIDQIKDVFLEWRK